MGSREEAVLEPVGSCPQTFVSFSRWKKVEERMSGVRGWGGGSLMMPVAFPEAAGSVDGVDGREAGFE